MLINIAAPIFVIGVLVLFHELGHFLVAKRSGIRVEVFSIGFGPAIVSFRKGETDYKVGWVPLGGYVKMSSELPEGDEEGGDEPWRFYNKSVPVRSAVILAGPVANMVLVFVVYTMIFSIYGVEFIETTRIGQVFPDSPAARAGIEVGDRIVEVDGAAVGDWGEMARKIVGANSDPLVLVVERGGEKLPLSVDRKEGEVVGFLPDLDARVGEVLPGGPADRGGLEKGDRILALDGVSVDGWNDLRGLIESNPGREITVRFEREGETMEIAVTPDAVKDETAAGVTREVGMLQIGQYLDRKSIGVVEAAREGLLQTAFMTKNTLFVLKALVTFRASKEMVGGPVSIFQLSGRTAKRGWYYLLSLIAGLSVGLGLLNLMPIPVLDGGHMVLLGPEGIRRKPVPPNMRATLQQIGLIVILILMVTVTVFDLGRMLD